MDLAVAKGIVCPITDGMSKEEVHNEISAISRDLTFAWIDAQLLLDLAYYGHPIDLEGNNTFEQRMERVKYFTTVFPNLNHISIEKAMKMERKWKMKNEPGNIHFCGTDYEYTRNM